MNAPLCDLDAERALVVACLTDTALVSTIAPIAGPLDFYDPELRAIYSGICDLSGTNWDVTTLARRLRKCHGEVSSSRAIQLMVELTAHPVVGNATGHAKSVSEMSRARAIKDILGRAYQLAAQGKPDSALEVVRESDRISIGGLEPKSFQQLLLGSYNVARSPREKAVLTSGHYQIDEMTGGLRGGFTWVIAAGSSEGKSSQAISIVDENLRRGARCLIVSIEDGEEVFGNRFLSRRSGVDAIRIRDHRLEAGDHSKITAAIEGAQKSPVLLHCSEMPFEKIAAAMDQIILQESIDLVVLDYIQECWTEERYQSRMLELQAIARRFRSIVRRRKIAGIICSQLTGHEPGKPPTKEMVRECRDIANGAEVVMLLFSKIEQGERGEENKVRLANIDKAKDGRTGVVELDWDNRTASFRCVKSAEQQQDELIDQMYDDVTDALGAISM